MPSPDPPYSSGVQMPSQPPSATAWDHAIAQVHTDREHFEVVADANRLDDTPGTAVAQVKRVAYVPVARGQAQSV